MSIALDDAAAAIDEALDGGEADAVAETPGALTTLVGLLSAAPPAARVATRSVARLAEGGHSDGLREAGVMLPLVALLAASSNCEHEAMHALGRLAYDNEANQDALRHAGALERLVDLQRHHPDVHVASQAEAELQSLSRDNPSNRDAVQRYSSALLPRKKAPPLVSAMRALQRLFTGKGAARQSQRREDAARRNLQLGRMVPPTKQVPARVSTL